MIRETRGPSNLVRMYDFSSGLWSTPSISGTHPSQRYSHASAVLGSILIVWGGTDGKEIFDDLWMLNTESLSWQKRDPIGTLALGRYGSCADIIDKKLYIYGGISGAGHVASIDVYDFGANSYSTLELLNS